MTDFSIRVIAAGGPHQQGTREGDDDDAKHGHRGNGLAQYRRGDDHAHGGVDGEQRADIERLIRNEGLEGRIMITGWVDNPIAYACLFNQALLLSRWEGFGLVLAEYMKLEKPIVATNVDAIPDLITDYENGLLVEADNVDQAVEAVYKLYNDNFLREKVIKNGSMRVNAFFNVSRVANEHERLIVKLCEQGDKK